MLKNVVLLLVVGLITGESSSNAALHPNITVIDISAVGRAGVDMLPNASYNGMMFAGGIRINGSASWVARVCTNGCTHAPFDSQIILGRVAKVNSSEALSWIQGAHVGVKESGVGSRGSSCTGPEDPRIDVVGGQRFFLASVTVQPANSDRCSSARKQIFVPIDAGAGSQCLIQVDEPDIEECHDQKNWVPLIPEGSNTPFFVYSLVPFQVVSFDRQSCKAKAMQSGGIRPPDLSTFRSSTRYVHGIRVTEGDIYWSVGHTAPLEYRAFLSAVLVIGREENTSFELMGTSCAFRVPGLLEEAQLFAYPNSILDFNAKNDSSEITFHIDDAFNKVVTVRGIARWLREAYALWKQGASFKCNHQVGSIRNIRVLSSNCTNGTNESCNIGPGDNSGTGTKSTTSKDPESKSTTSKDPESKSTTSKDPESESTTSKDSTDSLGGEVGASFKTSAWSSFTTVLLWFHLSQ